MCNVSIWIQHQMRGGSSVQLNARFLEPGRYYIPRASFSKTKFCQSTTGVTNVVPAGARSPARTKQDARGSVPKITLT